MKSISAEELVVEFQSEAMLDDRKTTRRMWTRAAYELPPEGRQQIRVAHSIAGAAAGVRCAINITEYGVFPQTELPNMYHQLRRSFGITTSVKENSCDVFDETENDRALLFVGAALLNGWDFWFLTPRDQVVILCSSHDDIISLETKDPKLRQSLVERWEEVGCKRLSQRYLRELAPLLFADE